MKSKWADIKDEVLMARRRGDSMDEIETTFGVPKSTQNSWFSKIKLPTEARRVLNRKKLDSLANARKKALIWHNAQKIKRIETARASAEKTLEKTDTRKSSIIELALAMLYLGEGFKTNATGMGNSDPLILRFFLNSMARLYDIDTSKIRFNLHLRADQNPAAMKKFWSEKLQIPQSQFKGISIDKRTIGKDSYAEYKGVCSIDCGNVAIQRKLVYLSKTFCEKSLEDIQIKRD